MRSQSSIEAVLRRELDSLPLPPESRWFPAKVRGSGWGTSAWVVTGVAVLALAILAGPALRDWRDLQDSQAARPTPLVFPTVVNGVGLSPLRNVSRHPELGFNLVLPANWRETARTSSGRFPPPIAGVTYTAQTPDSEVSILSRYGRTSKLPWDVEAELWGAGGMTAIDWARERGGCGVGCSLGPTTIHGTEFVTSIDSATGAHVFYALRAGDRILVLSYVLGNVTERPQGVTPDTLEEIVRSVGLP